MNPFVIFADSSCDLPAEFAQRHGIIIVPYYVSFNGENYYKEGIDINNETFYRTLRQQKVFPKTSLPPISDYMDAFRGALSQGSDILCICLTSKFSGSFQCATIAKNSLLEEFPGRSILVADSMQASATQGLLALMAARLRHEGKSLEETYGEIEQVKRLSKIYITVDSLEYLQRGGRIGKVSALAGGLLGIKPVISMENGELIPVSKARGRKKAVAEVVDLSLAGIGGRKEDYTVAVIHSDCLPEAHELINILNTVHGINVDLPPFELGVTIGAHIGPTVLAVAYMKNIV